MDNEKKPQEESRTNEGPSQEEVSNEDQDWLEPDPDLETYVEKGLDKEKEDKKKK